MTFTSSADPLTLPWGAATPERVDAQRKIAFHIVNHALGVPAATQRTRRFLLGRINWFRRNLPAGFRQVVAIDDRGQPMSDDERSLLRAALMAEDVEIRFFSEGVFGGF